MVSQLLLWLTPLVRRKFRVRIRAPARPRRALDGIRSKFRRFRDVSGGTQTTWNSVRSVGCFRRLRSYQQLAAKRLDLPGRGDTVGAYGNGKSF